MNRYEPIPFIIATLSVAALGGRARFERTVTGIISRPST